MKYKITHATTYEYADLVPVCQNITHLVPRHGGRQRCTYHRLIVKPTPINMNRRVDYFGNVEHDFAVHEGHRSLRITAISKVEIQPYQIPAADPTPAWEMIRDSVAAANSPEELDARQFCFESPHIGGVHGLAGYTAHAFRPGRPLLESALELNHRIHHEFTYDQDATNVSTPVADVFQHRRGVCQDLAHVAIGCLRSIGLPARYVSGYLRTIPPAGKPRLVGADASHAWFSVYTGASGWVDLDPTNDLVVSQDHITLAWGRDYGDVAPVRGVFVGGGRHQIIVAVDVVSIE